MCNKMPFHLTCRRFVTTGGDVADSSQEASPRDRDSQNSTMTEAKSIENFRNKSKNMQ